MQSRAYVEGMLKQSRKLLTDLYWFQFIKRARIKGWIEACESVLEDPEHLW